MRLPCSKALATRFDASIPQGYTPASWLCEIVETLLSVEESELQALNKQGPRAMPRERADDLKAGGKNIRTRISSFLWAEIEKRAAGENASSATDWLRTLVARAVQPPMNWRKQEPPPHLPTGAPKPKSPQEWKAARQIVDLERTWARWLKKDLKRVMALNKKGQLYQQMLKTQQAEYQQLVHLPAGAPKPKSPHEWKAASQTGLRDEIWAQWKATDPEEVHSLQQLGLLYQEMLRAQQAYYRVRKHLSVRGEEPMRADEQAKRDSLRWEGPEEALDQINE